MEYGTTAHNRNTCTSGLKFIFWTFILTVVDQAVKIVINIFFFDRHFEIIPYLFEFKPIFNDKHSYINSLLYHNFGINSGLLFHVVLYAFGAGIMAVLYLYFRNNIVARVKLLDMAMNFLFAGIICALIGNLIWTKGTLDFIYLKPLFIFDLKDIYADTGTVLFLAYAIKNRDYLKQIKTKDMFTYAKNKLKQYINR
jgi:hypothetical protein